VCIVQAVAMGRKKGFRFASRNLLVLVRYGHGSWPLASSKTVLADI
jgi:hypothetical protein